MTAENNVEDGLLRASGLSSVVQTESGERLGHILMLDYDDVTDAFDVVAEIETIPGVSIVLESSPGSFHGYNLSVRPFESQVTDAASKDGEMGHVRQSARRGYFVLRWSKKIHEQDGTVYKPAPSMVSVSVDPSTFPQSEPHLTLFAKQAEREGKDRMASKLREARETVETVGGSISMDHYQTGTDRLKERVRE